MKLILHHFWKDVRLMRWILALWFLILAVQTLLLFLAVQPERLVKNGSAFDLSATFPFVISFTWALIVVRLIQSEPVTGTNSFWRTRPVPPLVLGASKLFFITALTILPTLFVHWLELTLFHFESDEMGKFMGTLVLMDAVLAIFLIWMATYTRSLVQFWAIVCALGLATFVYQTVTTSNRLSTAPMSQPQLVVSELGSVLFWCGLLGSLVVQYGFRRTRLAFWMGIGGVVVGTLPGVVWPFVIRHDFAVSSPVDKADARIDYRLANPHAVTWSNFNAFRKENEVASVNLLFPEGDNPRGYPKAESSRAWFQSNGSGRKMAMESADLFFGERGVDWLSALQKENPGLTVVQSMGHLPSQQVRFELPGSQAEALRGTTGTLYLNIHGHFLKLEKRAEMPLNGPRFVRIPNFIVQVTSANLENNGVNLEMNSLGYGQPTLGLSRSMVFLLVDSRNHIGVVMPNSGSASSGSTITGIAGYDRISETATFGFDSRSFPPAIQAKILDNRLADWTLYIYQIKPSDTFESDITAPDLKL